MLLYHNFDFTRISILFRALYGVLFVFVILIFLNKTRSSFIAVFIPLLFLFITGQLLFAAHFQYGYNYVENILIFTKYYFVFIIYFALYKLPSEPLKFAKAIRVLESIFLFNSLAVILGFILKVELLRTYLDQPYRYGFSGFIPAQNEATLFFFLSVSYFYYKHFVLGIKSSKFWIVAFSAILLGTKGIYIFLGLLVLYHLLSHSGLKAKLASLLFVIMLVFGAFWFLQTEVSEKVLQYFIFQQEESGYLSMILSNRNVTLNTTGPQILSKWNFLNYLGGGQDQTKFLIELDFVDLFFFMGIAGSIIYLGLYFITLFKFKLSKTFNLLFVIAFFGLAAFGGHFFSSALNALYICLVSMYIYTTQKESPKPA